MIRATPQELELIQQVIESVDKNRAEVVKVGESVPVSIGTNYVPGVSVVTQGAGATTPPASPIGAGGSAFESIQYRDVGLVIDVTPTITTGGYVEIKMKLESTSVVPGADPTRPRFTQRTLATVSRVEDGKTAVVAGIKQESRGDTRTSIPVLGMLPFLGRFFSAPRQTSDLRDIVITIAVRTVIDARF